MDVCFGRELVVRVPESFKGFSLLSGFGGEGFGH